MEARHRGLDSYGSDNILAPHGSLSRRFELVGFPTGSGFYMFTYQHGRGLILRRAEILMDGVHTVSRLAWELSCAQKWHGRHLSYSHWRCHCPSSERLVRGCNFCANGEIQPVGRRKVCILIVPDLSFQWFSSG